MDFWADWSLVGIFLGNFIGVMWIDIYLGFFSQLTDSIFGFTLFERQDKVYERDPELRNAANTKLVVLLANMAIAIRYFGDFKEYIAYKSELNYLTVDQVNT